jgi:DNA topoisomerase VI subunit B
MTRPSTHHALALPTRHRAATLDRAVFRTSRALEYFSEKELILQTGHDPDRWPEVVVKELVDNALDACEAADTLPVVRVTVSARAIVVEDNGPGLPATVIKDILDYSVRTSSKDAYISPTRGAQGNALKTVLAIPYVLSGRERGEVAIVSRGEDHRIVVTVDRIAQQPKIRHVVSGAPVKTGTRVEVRWPNVACSILREADARFLQLLETYALFNPHATFEYCGTGDEVKQVARTAETPRKWLANAPTSPHWYTAEQLRNLAAAYIAAERNGGRARTAREFISEFHGLSGSLKQKAILARLPALAGVHLRHLVKHGDVDRTTIAALLEAMQAESRPLKPAALGILGEVHLRGWLTQQLGADTTITYVKTADIDDESGRPYVLETAFGIRQNREGRLRLVTGINWAPTLIDPFRDLGSYGLSLDGLLHRLHLDEPDPVTFVLHLACPHLNYTDRGKSSLEGL